MSKKQITKGEKMKKTFIFLLAVLFLTIGTFAIVGKAFEKVSSQKIFIISVAVVIIFVSASIFTIQRRPLVKEEMLLLLMMHKR